MLIPAHPRPTFSLAQPAVVPVPPKAKWPLETDIIFIAGTNRVLLTLQHPLVRTVVHDGFENLRASLLFDNAFPDATLTASVVRDALIAGAKGLLPRAAAIYDRILSDVEYAPVICPLVSSLIVNMT
jgi:hypothetical protein